MSSSGNDSAMFRAAAAAVDDEVVDKEDDADGARSGRESRKAAENREGPEATSILITLKPLLMQSCSHATALCSNCSQALALALLVNHEKALEIRRRQHKR